MNDAGGAHAAVAVSAWGDLTGGWQRRWLWWRLARDDIRLRYTGTLLGPFWLTLGTVMLTLCLALLFHSTLGGGMRTYLPYVAIGLVMWQFLQGLVIEACVLFQSAGDAMRSIALPLSTHAMRLAARHLFLLAHSLTVVMLLLWATGMAPVPHWSIVPALLVLPAIALLLALVLGIAGARFRDLSQVFTHLMQLLFFVTPIFWLPQRLLAGNAQWASINPVYGVVNIVRAPLMGRAPDPASWPIVGGLTLLALALTPWLLRRAQRRLIFWI